MSRKYYITTQDELSEGAITAIRHVPGNNVAKMSGDRYLVKCKVKPPEITAIEEALSKIFEEKSFDDIKTEKTTVIEV